MSNDVDPDDAFPGLLDRPATRGEILHLAQLTSVALLGQGLVNLAMIEGDEAMQRRHAERAIDQAGAILEGMREMLNRWKAAHGS